MQKFEFLGHGSSDVSFKKGLPNLEKLLEVDSENVNEKHIIHGKDEAFQTGAIQAGTVETEALNSVQNSKSIDALALEVSSAAIANDSSDVHKSLTETQNADTLKESFDANNPYIDCLISIADSLQKLQTETNEKINKFLSIVAESAVAISKDIIDKEFKNIEYYKILVDDIMSAVKKVEKSYVVTIKVNPKYKENLLSDFSSNTYLTNNLQYKVVFDVNLTEYDSIVEWEDGKVENILQNKINQLESIVKEHLVGLDKTYGNN